MALILAAPAAVMTAPEVGRGTGTRATTVGVGVTIRLQTRNDSAVAGAVTLTAADGRTAVAVTVAGGEPGLPVFIQRGPCGAGAAVPAFPLTDAFPTRTTTTLVDARLDDLLLGGYSISVRRRALDLATLTAAAGAVACGDLVPPDRVGIPAIAAVDVPPRVGTGHDLTTRGDQRGTVMLALGLAIVGLAAAVAVRSRRVRGQG